MHSEFVNRELAEHIVQHYGEDTLRIEGFNRNAVSREGNTIRARFSRVMIEEANTFSAMLRATDWLSEKDMVRLTSHFEFHLMPGDTLHIDYKLSWFWRGGGGKCTLREPMPGAKLVLVTSLAI